MPPPIFSERKLQSSKRDICRYVISSVRPGQLSVPSQNIPYNIIFFYLQGIHLSSAAGDKINGSFQNYSHIFKIVEIQGMIPSGAHDPSGRFLPDPRHSQQSAVIRPVDLHREKFQMPYRPVALRIQEKVKIRSSLRQQFLCLKSVKAQQPVRLIQPVFPEKRRSLGKDRQRFVLVD